MFAVPVSSTGRTKDNLSLREQRVCVSAILSVESEPESIKENPKA